MLEIYIGRPAGPYFIRSSRVECALAVPAYSHMISFLFSFFLADRFGLTEPLVCVCVWLPVCSCMSMCYAMSEPM